MACLVALLVPTGGFTQGIESLDTDEAPTSADEPSSPPVWLGVEIERSTSDEVHSNGAGSTEDEARSEATEHDGDTGTTERSNDDDAASETKGVRVVRVVEDSPAARSGLKPGDRILRLDGEAVSSLATLQPKLEPHAPRDDVELAIRRGETRKTMSVRLSARPGRKELIRARIVGSTWPDAALERVPEDSEKEGTEVATSDLTGTPAVVEFFATWCAPCRELEPALQSLREEYGSELEILAVSSESAERLRAYRRESDALPYTLLRDPSKQLHDRWFVASYPTVVVLDASGRVVEVLFGLDARDRLESVVESVVETSDE